MALERQSVGDDGNKTARLPRWTRQEIVVLIQGKKVAESRVRGRTSTSTSSSIIEPKWASVSSYCKRHGVDRGPVQCRKRWSNLAGDFKKIKEWENNNTDESDSFWVMRNDLRRQRKLPGFYDKEVYHTLDANIPAAAGEDIISYSTGLSLAADDYAAAAMDVLSLPAPTPFISVPPSSNPASASQPPPRQEGRKRKRLSNDGDIKEAATLQDHLIQVLKKTGMMLNAQLEAHNKNLELDRQQRNEHTSSLLVVLNKLADALGKIVEKKL